MSLDISKLEFVAQRPEKTEAACPACTEQGNDHSRDNLVIFPSGAFTCARDKTKEHLQRIHQLAGLPMEARSPIPVEIHRAAYMTAEPQILGEILLDDRMFDYAEDQKAETALAEWLKQAIEATEASEEWLQSPLSPEEIAED